jgi:hypothetical protein
MRKILFGIIGLMLGVACTNARKATSWFDSHKDSAAGYCADRYPIKESVEIMVVTDSVDYKKAVDSLKQFAEPWIDLAQRRNQVIDSLIDFIDRYNDHEPLQFEPLQFEEVDRLKKQLKNLKRIDTSALRKEIEQELKGKIRPCKDTTITITKENTARVAQLQGRLNKMTSSRDGWRTAAFIAFSILALLVLLAFIYKRREQKRKS